MGFQLHHLPVPGATLHIRCQGCGFPLLCLHGHPGSGQSLSVFTDLLGQQLWAIAPDLRGYGNSRVTSDFTMTDHLSDLQQLLDQMQVDRCLVLGWSLGGILALELALQCPDRVSGLILVATAARPWSNHPSVGWQVYLWTAIASLLNRLKPGWQWNIDTFGKRSLYRYLIQQHTAIAYRYLAQDALPAYLNTSRPATRALSTALKQGYNRLPDLHQITCPTLVLAGSEDRHITAAASQETARHLSNATWICYPNTAHLFPWEIPDQVLADIHRWLADHPTVLQ